MLKIFATKLTDFSENILNSENSLSQMNSALPLFKGLASQAHQFNV